MTAPRLTTNARIAEIRRALERLKREREYYRLISADRKVESARIESAKDAFTIAVKEFGWQWDNVEAVLDALAPEEQ